MLLGILYRGVDGALSNTQDNHADSTSKLVQTDKRAYPGTTVILKFLSTNTAVRTVSYTSVTCYQKQPTRKRNEKRKENVDFDLLRLRSNTF